ncbi:MAG TPA: CHAT domain-containing tetratricopeptide repeat protein [Flavobacteriales bacterium]|nr:CHAT domain-containing tetratricopeptide repeat protein [Flavobacteriales bacterium]
MKSILLLLSFSGIAFSTFSQTKEVDSLLSILPKMKEDTSKVNVLNILSEKAGWRIRKYDDALKYANNALPLAEKLKFKKGQANAFNNLGNINNEQKNTVKALEYHEKSLALRKEIGDKFGMGRSLNNIGLINYNIGNYDEAIAYYEQSLDVRTKIGDKAGMASTLNNMGIAHENKLNYAKTLEYYEKSLAIRYELGAKPAIANSLNNIGNIYRRQGNYQKALRYYEESLKTYEEVGDKRGIAGTQSNIGLIYEQLGDFAKTIECYEKSLNIFEKINDKQGVALCMNNIGIVYENQGNNAKSLEYHEKSLQLREKIGDKTGIASSLNNIGIIYFNHGNYQKAIEYYDQSMKIDEAMNNKQAVALSQNNFGIVYRKLGNYSLAMEYYEKSLKQFEEIGSRTGIANALNNIGVVYISMGNYDKALEYYQKSLVIFEEIQQKEATANTLNNIGQTHAFMRNFKEAVSCNKKALQISKSINTVYDKKNALRLLTIAYTQSDTLPKAKRHVEELVKVVNENLKNDYFTLSEQEKGLYFSLMEEDFGLYHNFTVQYHDKYPVLADTAYNLALANKGLSLKSSTVMRNAIRKSNDTVLIRQYDDWLILKRKISKAYETGKDAREYESKAEIAERELVKKSTAFNDFDKLLKLDWKQVRAALNKNEAAIEFIQYKNQLDKDSTKRNDIVYAAYIIHRGSLHPQIVKLCTEQELKDIIGSLQGNNLSFVNRIYGTRKKAKKELYQKTWQPLEKYLTGITNVYYSPTGLLHKISFAAISKEDNFFLCDAYNLNQQGSSGKLAIPGTHVLKGNENYTLIGGIKYTSDSSQQEMWAYLPGTLTETKNIQVALQKKKQHVNSYTEQEASESNFKQQIAQTNILHIATHGFFYPDPELLQRENDMATLHNETGVIAFRGSRYAEWSFIKNKNPLMRSGIVLAGANAIWNTNEFNNTEDGVLTAFEVSNLDMQHTKLVVLSACETGLGDVKGNEGVFGLQRSFKMAGVENLIMSLWQVPDKETSEFMQSLYKNILELKNIKAAFNRTQKAMRKKYDPYYWGAFVLIE